MCFQAHLSGGWPVPSLTSCLSTISFTPWNGHEKPKGVKQGINLAKVSPSETWRGKDKEDS